MSLKLKGKMHRCDYLRTFACLGLVSKTAQLCRAIYVPCLGTSIPYFVSYIDTAYHPPPSMHHVRFYCSMDCYLQRALNASSSASPGRPLSPFSPCLVPLQGMIRNRLIAAAMIMLSSCF